MSLRSVYTLACSCRLCGRGWEVGRGGIYEWPYYHAHLAQILAMWIGGMSTHGLLLGSFVALGLFAWIERRSFPDLTDVIVIPAALIMAFARLANFVDGQIVGGDRTCLGREIPGCRRLPPSGGAVRWAEKPADRANLGGH